MTDEQGRESEARALGEQYEKLYAAGAITLEVPEDLKNTGLRTAVALAAPAGVKLTSLKAILDDFRARPERVRGTAQIRDLASFKGHLARFGKKEQAAVFAHADPDDPHLIAVYDYSTPETPAFHQHQARYSCQLSEHWKAWAERDSEWLSQADFAVFLEDRINDVLVPDSAGEDADLQDFANLVGGYFATPATLIELARGLSVRATQQVEQRVNTASGEAVLSFRESHEAPGGGDIRVPNLFVIGIPVFHAGATYRIPVRLRYRIHQGKVHWQIGLHRADKVLDHAFNQIVAAVEETGFTVFVGAPES